MEHYKVNVNGEDYKVTVEKSEGDEKVKHQKEQIRSIGRFFKDHPTLFLTAVSGYISISGLITLWIIFYRENVNLFDYASIADFFFGFFAVSLGPAIVLFTIILLSVATWSYYHKPWKSFWTLVTLYLIAAPMLAPIFIYKPYTLCSPKFDKYVVTYRVPNLTKDDELYLIASLSSYKIFKKEYPGCKVPIGEYDKHTKPHGTEVIAINDGIIASMKIQPKKT